jgi:hypothetical protein
MGRSSKLKALEDVNLLEIKPVRVAEWEEVGDRVVVIRPAPGGRGFKRLVNLLFFALAARRIRLDDVGSAAWRQLDGENTVAQVALKLREEFGERIEPAEERFGHQVRVFRREGLVAYPGWDVV